MCVIRRRIRRKVGGSALIDDLLDVTRIPKANSSSAEVTSFTKRCSAPRNLCEESAKIEFEVRLRAENEYVTAIRRDSNRCFGTDQEWREFTRKAEK